MNQYFTNNENLKSKRRIIKYTTGSSCFEFISDNGVFSKDKIDYGSRLLVDTYLNNKKEIKSFLDVGCGYGFISIILSKIINVPGVGVDINKRALKLASENAQKNQVSVSFKESNIYENIEEKFDLIITNPPIRAGKTIVLRMLKEVSEHLTEDGELWFVIRKDQGAKSIIKELNSLYKIDIKEKSKGFYIIVAKKN
ncbi:MAG: methyltransferase [Bacilli bacterium]|nr:methyltransferase [Bacilli bacterium]